MSNDYAIFDATLDRAISALADKEYLRPVRRILARYHRQIKSRVIASPGAGVPALGQRVAQAVRGRVYRDTSGMRVFVANNRRLGSGMFATLRPSQPALPPAYWYEHGYAGPRHTRGRNGARPHSTGGGHTGVHALDSLQGESAAIEAAIMAELEPFLPNLLDHIHVK